MSCPTYPTYPLPSSSISPPAARLLPTKCSLARSLTLTHSLTHSRRTLRDLILAPTVHWLQPLEDRLQGPRDQLAAAAATRDQQESRNLSQWRLRVSHSPSPLESLYSLCSVKSAPCCCYTASRCCRVRLHCPLTCSAALSHIQLGQQTCPPLLTTLPYRWVASKPQAMAPRSPYSSR